MIKSLLKGMAISFIIPILILIIGFIIAYTSSHNREENGLGQAFAEGLAVISLGVSIPLGLGIGYSLYLKKNKIK